MIPDPKKKAIRLSPSERAKLKKDLYYNRAHGKCETCGKAVPYSVNGGWDAFTCAHLSHIKSSGSGGSDIASNLKVECPSCHMAHHGPRWNENKD